MSRDPRPRRPLAALPPLGREADVSVASIRATTGRWSDVRTPGADVYTSAPASH
jgi:hypothetical protein